MIKAESVDNEQVVIVLAAGDKDELDELQKAIGSVSANFKSAKVIILRERGQLIIALERAFRKTQ